MYEPLLIACLMGCMIIVVLVPVCWKVVQRDSVAWSHRCYSTIYNENTGNGCKDALDSGFIGIEIDVIYENNTITVRHNLGVESNETLKDILMLLQDYTYDMLIDFKTREYYLNASIDIDETLKLYPPGGKIIIETRNREYDNFFQERGYKTTMIGHYIGKDVILFSDTAFWWAWPAFFFTNKETYISTVETQCEYKTVAWAKPSVIFVDLTSPKIECKYSDARDTVKVIAWVLFWCVAWIGVTICMYYAIRYMYNRYSSSSSYSFVHPYTKLITDYM